MKEIYVKDSETLTNLSQIEEFEKLIHAKLPQDYKQFLLKHNGGHPIQDCCDTIDCIQCYDENESKADVAWFLAIYDGKYNNIEKDYLGSRDRMPNELIPIADDSCGNTICLGVIEGKRYGKVYFWDHESEVEEGEEPYWGNVILIANSFTDFINSLYEFDVDGIFLSEDCFKSTKYISKHDKYSLPYSNELKGKNKKLISEFFNCASNNVEEFVIEEIETTKEKILIYEERELGKRYKRTIKTDGTFTDSIGDISSRE